MCNCNELLKLPLGNPGQDGSDGLLIVATLSPSSTGILYPAATANDAYRILTRGRIGTTTTSSNSKLAFPNDILYCITTNAGGLESAVGSSWMIIRGTERDFERLGTHTQANLGNVRGEHTLTAGATNMMLGFNNTNVNGNSNLIGGSGNSNTGNSNLLFGLTNTNTANFSLMHGATSINDGDSSIVFGDNHDNGTGAYNTLIGSNHQVADSVTRSVVHGSYGSVNTSDTKVHAANYFGVAPAYGHNQNMEIKSGAWIVNATPTNLIDSGLGTDLLVFPNKTAFTIEGDVLMANISTNAVAKGKFLATGSQKTGTAVLDAVFWMDNTGAWVAQGVGPYADWIQIDAGLSGAPTIDFRVLASGDSVNFEYTGKAATTIYCAVTLNVKRLAWF